jgi:hypothetical protein
LSQREQNNPSCQSVKVYPLARGGTVGRLRFVVGGLRKLFRAKDARAAKEQHLYPAQPLRPSRDTVFKSKVEIDLKTRADCGNLAA